MLKSLFGRRRDGAQTEHNLAVGNGIHSVSVSNGGVLGGAPGGELGDAIERRAQEIGRELLEAARAKQSSWGRLLSRAFWQDELMNWAMKDAAFKVQLFRFVDAFPSLRDPAAVHEHLVDYLTQPGVTLPPGLSMGLSAGGMGGLAKGMMARTVTSQIESMAGTFIAGRDAKSAVPVLRKLWDAGMCFSVDLLGEACVSEAEVEEYRRRYLDLVETLPGAVAGWGYNAALETDAWGRVPRTNVSIKVSSLSAKLDPADWERSLDRSFESLRPILESAKRHGVLVNFDMESHGLKDLTLALFMRCCEAVEFEAGVAMQAYLRSGDEDARRIVEWSKRTGRVVTVRLVKGAYWDYETIHADSQGWPTPVWGAKRDTDACFERMARAFVEGAPGDGKGGRGGVKLALGSHNLRSIGAVLAMVEARGLPASAVELQMLHGMADGLKGVMVDRGLRLREYVPVGEMIPGMAYFVRRLLENTSNEGWLRAGFSDGASVERLLASPHGEVKRDATRAERAAKHALSVAAAGVGDSTAFFTEPMRDLSDRAQREAFARAVAAAKVPTVAVNATIKDAKDAVIRAFGTFPAWRATDVRVRAGVLVRAAELMRQRRDELSGIIIRENGKNWRNADADVCEAIDFCEYYAREAVGLFTPGRLGRFAGELNEVFHQPRGVAVVISPWNFPLAIACGMVGAALVTGNTVVFKPAEQTPGIGLELYRILQQALSEAGAPLEVLGFVPGEGEVGAALVRDEMVRLVAFTGSRDVGLDILRACAPRSPFEPGFVAPSAVKRVVCEMGGKNAIIIDTSADLDEAVLGVRESAFGFAGQKCSACSRVIVVGDELHDVFVRRLVESSRSLVVGDPTDPGVDIGPVIDDGAAKKIREYIEIGKGEGKLELSMLREEMGARYIGPHIFTGIGREHRLAREEIFGPVLAVLKAGSFEEALRIANDSDYKLTGGVYSRKPSHLKRAREEYRVGNLYLNRPITGALVGRQPFGGFGMSGVGSKAGGKDYLQQFVEPRVVTENTMRRGFAPED
jgi:RHH-type proline utilization regulon transcriptional repressor/proline dehydrogenase/delta 1-pyrroline-5-carboxylate dehydrogenase